MKLFIPVVGTELKLSSDIQVSIKHASQNNKFIKSYEQLNKNIAVLRNRNLHLTLPKGLELTVDRVYVRQGDGADFNSLTFKTEGYIAGGIPKGRFFISVDDVNKLDVEIVSAKPSKKLPLVKSLQKTVASFNYNNRPKKFELLTAMIGEQKPVSKGTVFVNLIHDLEVHLEALAKRLDGHGKSSVEEAKEELIKQYGPDGYATCVEHLSDTRQRLLNQTKVPVLYFEQYIVEGESVLLLKNLRDSFEDDWPAIFARLNNTMRCVDYSISKKNYNGFIIDYGLGAVIHEDSPLFGTGHHWNAPLYKSELNPCEAFFLSSGFSKSVIFHTKDSDKYNFSYQLDGEDISVAALRREMNKKLKAAGE